MQDMLLHDYPLHTVGQILLSVRLIMYCAQPVCRLISFQYYQFLIQIQLFGHMQLSQ